MILEKQIIKCIQSHFSHFTIYQKGPFISNRIFDASAVQKTNVYLKNYLDDLLLIYVNTEISDHGGAFALKIV